MGERGGRGHGEDEATAVASNCVICAPPLYYIVQ